MFFSSCYVVRMTWFYIQRHLKRVASQMLSYVIYYTLGSWVCSHWFLSRVNVSNWALIFCTKCQKSCGASHHWIGYKQHSQAVYIQFTFIILKHGTRCSRNSCHCKNVGSVEWCMQNVVFMRLEKCFPVERIEGTCITFKHDLFRSLQ